MIIEGMQTLPIVLNHISPGHDTLNALHHVTSIDWHGLAQLKNDTDLFGQVGRSWDNFVKTGQVWALLIGIVIGYLFKGFTTF